MKVMKRYCDYDYDNNCIILFDADDEINNEPFHLNATWISTGDNKDKKYHAAILKEQKVKDSKSKTKKKKSNQSNHEKMSIYQHLEIEYKQRKAAIKQQRLARRMAKKQRIKSMAAYQQMSPIATSHHQHRGNPNQNQIQYVPAPTTSMSPARYSPQPQPQPQPRPHLTYGTPSPPKYIQQHQHQHQQQYIAMNNSHNIMNPHYAMPMNVSLNASMNASMNAPMTAPMIQNMQNMQNNNNFIHYHRTRMNGVNVNVNVNNHMNMYRQ